jgi:hypothetical protein
MSDFDRGYLYGMTAACLAFLLMDVVDALIANPKAITKLVVLDRRDMAERKDNADARTPARMAGSGEGDANP